MIRLGDLFEIKNGYASSNIENIYPEKKKGLIEYKRPSNKLENTTAGYIEKNQIPNRYVFPKETLFVSTDGQGSHTFSYVASNDFVPNSNISVLIPNIEMSLIQKLYYAQCITANRYKFSYGRKPKGKRLADIMLPSLNEIPSWVYEVEIPDYSNVTKPYLDEPTPALNVEEWKEFRLDELFDIEVGKGPSSKFANENAGDTPFVSATENSNGVTNFTSYEPTHERNTITVSRNGSIGESFYQPVPFCATADVAVLNPRFNNNQYISLFIATILKQEKYKYNYGRKWNLKRMKETIIRLPATPEGNPDWEWMEKYMKTLRWSREV